LAGLRSGGRSVTGGGRLRAWMVGAEVALSVVLLIGATLLFRSLIGLQNAKPGIDPENLLTFRVQVPRARYPEPASRTRFFARAIEQMEARPGVTAASAINYLPFTPLVSATWVNIAGRPPAPAGAELVTNVRTVMPGYFRAMRIPLLRGRDFSSAHLEANAP